MFSGNIGERPAGGLGPVDATATMIFYSKHDKNRLIIKLREKQFITTEIIHFFRFCNTEHFQVMTLHKHKGICFVNRKLISESYSN